MWLASLKITDVMSKMRALNGVILAPVDPRGDVLRSQLVCWAVWRAISNSGSLAIDTMTDWTHSKGSESARNHRTERPRKTMYASSCRAQTQVSRCVWLREIPRLDVDSTSKPRGQRNVEEVLLREIITNFDEDDISMRKGSAHDDEGQSLRCALLRGT